MNAVVAHRPPTDPDDLDRISDLVYYEDVSASEPQAVGGAGAFCYYGPAEAAHLGGTTLAGWVDGLRDHVSTTHRGEEDFRVEYLGSAWRACRDVDERSTQVMLRRLPRATPALKDLRLSEGSIRELMLAPWLNDGGLVLISGLTGQGKSTIAGAMVHSRLIKFGGRCVAVNDVSELPLEGVHGPGTCREIVVDYKTTQARAHGFSGAIRRAYRSFPATRPALLFIGEVRDVETAHEVVKAAANGMLVITTIHAYDETAALMRLLSLAEQSMGEAASQSLAQALRLVLHHSLTLDPDQAGWSRGQFRGSAMVCDGPSHRLGHLIRKQEYSQMPAVWQHQNARLRVASQNGTPAGAILRELGSNPG